MLPYVLSLIGERNIPTRMREPTLNAIALVIDFKIPRFNVTMDPENDLPGLSKCTTCSFSEDFSNYWTAVLYFQHANGSFKRVRTVLKNSYELPNIETLSLGKQVPQLPGQLLGNVNGGMTVYYVQPDGGKKVTAFKKVCYVVSSMLPVS